MGKWGSALQGIAEGMDAGLNTAMTIDNIQRNRETDTRSRQLYDIQMAEHARLNQPVDWNDFSSKAFQSNGVRDEATTYLKALGVVDKNGFTTVARMKEANDFIKDPQFQQKAFNIRDQEFTDQANALQNNLKALTNKKGQISKGFENTALGLQSKLDKLKAYQARMQSENPDYFKKEGLKFQQKELDLKAEGNEISRIVANATAYNKTHPTSDPVDRIKMLTDIEKIATTTGNVAYESWKDQAKDINGKIMITKKVTTPNGFVNQSVEASPNDLQNIQSNMINNARTNVYSQFGLLPSNPASGSGRTITGNGIIDIPEPGEEKNNSKAQSVSKEKWDKANKQAEEKIRLANPVYKSALKPKEQPTGLADFVSPVEFDSTHLSYNEASKKNTSALKESFGSASVELAKRNRMVKEQEAKRVYKLMMETAKGNPYRIKLANDLYNKAMSDL